MPKINKVYIGSELVWPAGWKPGANTIAYFPLTSDLKDYSGLTPTATSGTITFTTKDGVQCAYNDGSSVQVSYNTLNFSTGNNPLTWSFRYWKDGYTNEWQVMISTGYGTTTRAKSMGFHNDQFWTGGWNNDTYHFNALSQQWALYTWTFDGSTTKAYLNGELKNSKAMTYSVDSNNYSCLFSQVIQGASGPTQCIKGYVRDVIIEDRVWSDQEISDYYNLTKGIFGL